MKRLAILLASAILVLALAACSGQESVFSDEIDDQTGAVTITAKNAGKGSALTKSGGVVLEEGQSLVVESSLDKGGVTVEVLDSSSDPVVEATVTGTGQDVYGFAPGEYSLSVTCDEDGTTGTIIVAVVDDLIFSQQNNDLEVTLARMSAWPKASAVDEAASGAGFESFTLPEGDIGLNNGQVNWMGYYYTEGVVEAYGGVGAAEIVVFKSAPDAAASIPADETAYSYNWPVDANGTEVACFGNIEGQTMKATWSADGYDYIMMIRGQGDMYDVFGLGQEDVTALVGAIK